VSTYLDPVHIRTLETLSVWTLRAPTFRAGTLTLEEHLADEAQFITFIQA